MKKLLFIALFALSSSLFAQDWTYCQDVEENGFVYSWSFGQSSAIYKVSWIQYEYRYYAAVYFWSDTSTGYVYGGWSNYNDMMAVKRLYDDHNSRGQAFHAYIRPNRSGCAVRKDF